MVFFGGGEVDYTQLCLGLTPGSVLAVWRLPNIMQGTELGWAASKVRALPLYYLSGLLKVIMQEEKHSNGLKQEMMAKGIKGKQIVLIHWHISLMYWRRTFFLLCDAIRYLEGH